MALLELEDVRTAYGTIEALKGISFTVEEGEVVTLIGSNGAGKSTTLRSINGLNQPRQGAIRFQGDDITKRPAHEIVRMGISQSPEGRRVFSRMTVLENLEMGAYQRKKGVDVDEDLQRVFDLFPRLKEREKQKAGTMSGGEQQMLAIGRALMTRPRLLMLDEPSQGIMPKLVDEIFQAVKRIRDAGMTVLIVEQRMSECLEIADRAYILQTGRVLMQGSAAEISVNPDVRKAYLGL